MLNTVIGYSVNKAQGLGHGRGLSPLSVSGALSMYLDPERAPERFECCCCCCCCCYQLFESNSL